MLKGLLTTLVLWLYLAAAPAEILAQVPAAEGQVVRHTISFPGKNNQYVHVNMRFPVDSGSVELSLPVWTPGSYLIRDFSAQLELLEAASADGRPLEVVKLAKSRWRIDTSGVSALVVDYDIWAGKVNVSESWVESETALLNGAGIFLYNEETKAWPQQVDVRLPEAWSSVHTSLNPVPGESRQFLARDYDELVDSPIVAGDTSVFPFEVDKHPYALVLASENELWDGEGSARDVAKIVKAQQDFWGVNPFDRPYLFFNLFMGKFGGLEHDHSTVMMCSPWQMRNRQDYIKWLGLVSHEFFHSWNIRRMRPEVFSEYDYQGEVYTRELWLAEGLTSYYDNLLLFRAGLIDVSDYLDLLAEEIRVYETTPGREVRSAELASFDTWIKQNQPDGNSINSNISYYRKGALIGFVTDMAIRRETSNRSSLDTVMRTMYARYSRGEQGHDNGRSPGGYPRGAFEDLVEAEAGAEVRKMVEDMLQTTKDPAVEEALDWVGLVLQRTPERAAAEQAGESAPGGVGVTWGVTGNQILAEKVMRGHPGAAAGILPGDELLAVNGWRVTSDNFLDRLSRLRPYEQAELTLARRDRILTLKMLVQHQIPTNYNILSRSNIRKSEKNRLEAWLGRDLRFR